MCTFFYVLFFFCFVSFVATAPKAARIRNESGSVDFYSYGQLELMCPSQNPNFFLFFLLYLFLLLFTRDVESLPHVARKGFINTRRHRETARKMNARTKCSNLKSLGGSPELLQKILFSLTKRAFSFYFFFHSLFFWHTRSRALRNCDVG